LKALTAAILNDWDAVVAGVKNPYRLPTIWQSGCGGMPLFYAASHSEGARRRVASHSPIFSA